MIDLTRFEGTDQDVKGLLGKQQALRSDPQRKKQKTDKSRPIPKHEPRGKFVRGPVPCDWLKAALALGGKAGNLAWALWWLAGIEGRNPVRLTVRVLQEFKIAPNTARRLLVEFERAGLVEVDRKRGRGPDVTLSEPPDRND